MGKFIVLKVRDDAANIKLHLKGAKVVKTFNNLPVAGESKFETLYKLVNAIIVTIGIVNMIIGGLSIYYIGDDYDDSANGIIMSAVDLEGAKTLENNASINDNDKDIGDCSQSFVNLQLYGEEIFRVIFGVVLIVFIASSAYKHTILGKFWTIFAMTGIFYLTFNFVYTYCIGCDVFTPEWFLNQVLSYLVQILCVIVYILHVKINALAMKVRSENFMQGTQTKSIQRLDLDLPQLQKVLKNRLHNFQVQLDKLEKNIEKV